jgi:hypothetical protein
MWLAVLIKVHERKLTKYSPPLAASPQFELEHAHFVARFQPLSQQCSARATQSYLQPDERS